MAKIFKWLLVLAVLAGLLWFLWTRGGPQPQQVIEQPIEKPAEAGADASK